MAKVPIHNAIVYIYWFDFRMRQRLSRFVITRPGEAVPDDVIAEFIWTFVYRNFGKRLSAEELCDYVEASERTVT